MFNLHVFNRRETDGFFPWIQTKMILQDMGLHQESLSFLDRLDKIFLGFYIMNNIIKAK